MHHDSPVYLNFCIVSLFLVNGKQALYVNAAVHVAGYLKLISDANVSPANKSLFTIS